MCFLVSSPLYKWVPPARWSVHHLPTLLSAHQRLPQNPHLIIATPFHLPLYIDNVTIQLYRPTHHRRRHIPSFEKYFYLKKRGESNFFTFLIQINLFFSFKKWLNMESWTLDSVVLLLENGAKGDENRQDSISAESQWILTGLSTLVNLKNSVPYIFVRLAKLAATMTGSSNGEIPRRRIVYLSSSSKV